MATEASTSIIVDVRAFFMFANDEVDGESLFMLVILQWSF